MSITLSENTSTNQLERSIASEMEKHISFLKKDLAKLRTGRAHPSMIEDLRVSCYGTQMPLKEVASISAPEAGLLVVQPWDKSILADIEKSLYASDLGITPLNDGNLIRLKIPPMTTSRRQELTKIIGQKLEHARIAVRNVRKDVQNDIRNAEKSKDISQDTSKRLLDLLQKNTDAHIKQCEQIAAQKEEEVTGA